MIEPFPVRYRRALSDPLLRQTLLQFQRKWRITREAGLSDADFGAKRQKLKSIKNDVIANLPAYVDAFTGAARRAGVTVVRADTAEDAVRYVADLATSRGASQIVKSKSMLSEEIDLNAGLEAAGIKVVETDLGEWIVQLAGERPSHIIAPAIHKNRRQIAELFEEATGKSVSREDIREQVGFARHTLRDEFLGGQIGISGANALVAETGTVVLVTNEGNAELVTSLPPVHVVLAGIEKLLPTLDDAMLQLELLAPSATGQITTSYVSWLTGPATSGHEMHIVLVDNGRTAMRESPLFTDALRCIRCGACSNVCPSYGVVGGHVFGYVYSGAIGLVNTPFHHGIEHDAGPQSLCVSCNACQTVCPVDIPLPRQILDARAWSTRTNGAALPQRAGVRLWSQRRLFQSAARLGAVLQQPWRRGEFLDVPGTRRLTAWRKLPALADRPFRDRWRDDVRPPLPTDLGKILEDKTVAFFVQCLTDWLYPDIGIAIVDVLRALGAHVVFPRSQHCCGLPGLDAGATGDARRMARQTIRVIERCHADFVVSGATSCVVAMLHDYPHLFASEPEWQIRAELQAARTYDFTTFLDRVCRLPDGSLTARIPGAATYHYFCQSYNVLGFRDEPIHLLRDVCGYELSALPEAMVCCGFGGSVSISRPELCSHILDRKLANLDSTEAPLLITDNPGCIMHLRGGIAATGRTVRVKHTAEAIAERVRDLYRATG